MILLRVLGLISPLPHSEGETPRQPMSRSQPCRCWPCPAPLRRRPRPPLPQRSPLLRQSPLRRQPLRRRSPLLHPPLAGCSRSGGEAGRRTQRRTRRCAGGETQSLRHAAAGTAGGQAGRRAPAAAPRGEASGRARGGCSRGQACGGARGGCSGRCRRRRARRRRRSPPKPSKELEAFMKPLRGQLEVRHQVRRRRVRSRLARGDRRSRP